MGPRSRRAWAAAFGSTLCALPAASSAQPAITTYAVSRTLSCTNDCTGSITIDGSMTTNALGPIGEANFVDWELVVESTHYSSLLEPGNSQVTILGSTTVVSTPDLLIITQPGSDSPSFGIFAIEDTVSPAYNVGWQLQGGEDGGASGEILSNKPTELLDAPFDQGYVEYGESFVLTLPEPNGGAAVALGALLACVGRRSRRDPLRS